MANESADRVKETSTTTGTGTYDLAGAVTGFQTFVAGIGTGNRCYYCATDGTDWEVGVGTVTDAATDTLSRDTILASSNAGAAVNWGAGTKDIFVTAPAQASITETETFTPTGSWTGGCAYGGRRRFIGDHVELEMWVVASGGITPISTNLYFDLPADISINVSKMAYGASSSSAINGVVFYRDNGTSDYHGAGVRLDTTNSRVYPYQKHASATAFGAFQHNAPFTFANGDHVWCKCSFPVTR